jgi:uncharacterized membrane protein YfcA
MIDTFPTDILGYATPDLAIVFTVFFLAAFAKGTTGLGFSTACLPFLVLAIGLKATLPLLLIPSITSNILVMRDAGHFRESVVRFWPMILAQAPGIVVGLWLLARVDPALAAAVLGAVLIAYCLFALGNSDARLVDHLEKPLMPPTGFVTGALNGLTGSQVMPVLPYLLALKMDQARLVQAVNCSFTFSSLLMMVGLSKMGLMTIETAIISTGGLVPVYVGIALGNRVRQHLKPELFRRLVLLTLIVFGGVLIGRLGF